METHTFWQKPYVQLLASLVLVGVIGALAAYIHLTLKEAQGMYTGEANISVTGEGEVLMKADIATFSFSVQAEGEDAATAQEASAESINAILGYLGEAGIEDKDIKTQNYNLYPKYSYEDRICLEGRYCPPGERFIDGYEVSQTVTVKVRDIDTAGDILSGVGERGATNISGLRFVIDDEEALKDEAREVAIADAKTKAKELADNLGMRLGKITGYWEEGNGGYYEPVMRMEAMEMSMDSAAASPSIPAGENTTVVRVNISYQLR